jgi:hypothetical protein
MQWLVHFFGMNTGILQSQIAIAVIILLSCFGYLLVALRNVYPEKIWLILLKAGLLSLSVIALLRFVYRIVLFYVVMHTIGE